MACVLGVVVLLVPVLVDSCRPTPPYAYACPTPTPRP